MASGVNIKGFIENSLIEWEGKIAAVVFLPGCNLRCHYCHASHLILHPERLEDIPPQQILRCLSRQKGWLDGVVFSGGEPTLHGDELAQFISQVKALGLAVMVETNGTRPDQLWRLIHMGLVDAFAMDFKAPLTSEDYQRVCGVPVCVDDVRLSMELIRSSRLPYEFRITLVPGLVGPSELERMAGHLEGARQVALQNFRPDLCLSPALRSVAPFGPEALDAMQRMIAPAVGRCVVRGRDRAGLAAQHRN